MTKLGRRDPPLDLQTVRAVILYASSYSLGPDYIYSHLDNGDPVDPLFMDLAALDETMLAAFQRAATELATAGILAPETQALIPSELVALFARSVEMLAGFEAEGVVTMFRRGEVAAGQKLPGSELVQEKDELTQLWERVRERLRLQMTQSAFVTRVKNTRLIGWEGGRFTIAAQNVMNRDWLANRYADMIHRTLASELGEGEDELKLEFVVAENDQVSDNQARWAA